LVLYGAFLFSKALSRIRLNREDAMTTSRRRKVPFWQLVGETLFWSIPLLGALLLLAVKAGIFL
jgi:hypothetical protein